jgi:dipeptidyl aminopeptidase/acylaminoacyl peptidase
MKYIYKVSYFLCLVLVSCPVLGQVLTKRQLTESDYNLWGTMKGEQISNTGRWVSYQMTYPSKCDTLFVYDTNAQKKFSFPDYTNGRFAGEGVFACQKKDTLLLYHLKTAKKEQIAGVKRYEFSSDGDLLVTLKEDNQLLVCRQGVLVDRIANVKEYKWNNAGKRLVYVSFKNDSSSVGLLSFGKRYQKRIVLKNNRQHFKHFTWQFKNNSFAFYGSNDKEDTLFLYDDVLDSLRVLTSSESIFPQHMKIASDQNVSLTISRDGNKVFFGITPVKVTETLTIANDVAVWNTKDQMLYSNRARKATVLQPQYLAVWIPKKGIVRQLSSKEESYVFLTGNQDYALVGNPLHYEPQYKWIADMDYYIIAVESGHKELFLPSQSGYISQIGFSPCGRYITYYRNLDWWIYSIKSKSHVNVTNGLGVCWDNKADDAGNELKVWGNPGWSSDGKHVLYYDSHDVWLVAVDGTLRKRLTQGKENKLRLRLDASSIIEKFEFNFTGRGISSYDISKPVLLTATDMYQGTSGYYTWFPQKGMKPLVMNNSATTKYKKATHANDFIIVNQRFDSPPALHHYKANSISIVNQSNEQHQYYQWGRSEMIHYNNSKGIGLNGALFYPAGYDATQYYPMVVYIYETVSRDVATYVNPSLYNTIGFNIANFTSKGYVVLLADIAFEKGNPGYSALDCITAAVDKVVTMGFVDAKRIGLIGHSFGAYETNFILTQTNIFAAGVSGSGVADIVGHYFTYNTEQHSIDSWRYENQQYRMGFSFFENKDAYFRNSPILHADKITTPLLTWVGASDKNVQPRQAELFYSALRRLKKNHIMLVYPNEGHVLNESKNQADLTQRIQEWFDYYLLKSSKPDWVKADFENN